jgi:stringent starvation protein B
MEYVKDGEIVLNISPDATRNLKIDNDLIRFSARFNGVSREVSVPVGVVKGIFARETGQGLAFQVVSSPEAGDAMGSAQENDDSEEVPPETGRSRAHLQIVKK